MKKCIFAVVVVMLVTLAAGTAMAESIEGRFGVTGHIGFLIPSDSDYQNFKVDTDAGFIGGGGFIYGINRNIAAEVDITHTWYGSNFPLGGNSGDFSITDISFGGQYRFDIAKPSLVPYAGAGLDVLLNDYKTQTGLETDVDTVVGIHLNGGIDYFIMRELALNAELKAVIAPEADINALGGKQGNFDPSSFSGLFGFRFFFN